MLLPELQEPTVAPPAASEVSGRTGTFVSVFNAKLR